MKKIALWLTAMALGLCLGCAPDIPVHPPMPVIEIDLKFRKGQVVNLKIGGRGQIIEANPTNGVYRVRVRTDDGSKFMWFHEFELEVTPGMGWIQWSEKTQ